MIMLDDSILGHLIFDGLPDSADSFYNIKQILTDAGVTFPAKMTWEPVKPTVLICFSVDSRMFYAKDQVGEYETLAEIYDAVDRRDVQVKFDESVRLSGEVEDFMGDDLSMIGVRSERKGFRRILIGRGQEGQDTLDYSHYYHFLLQAKQWLADQDDFVKAYSFIQMHPAFWYRPIPERSPYHWATDNGHESVWVCVTRNDKNEPVVMLEHGSSVEPEHTMHYHDFRLDVWAPTFEEAYIDLAKKTHKFFSLDGEERPDVEYKKTKLELELEERLEEAKKDLDSE
jgi:hypothetical protein